MLKRIINKIVRKIKGISNAQLTLEANLKAGLKVGENCSGLLDCDIDYGHAWLIEIGDNVVFAPKVYLLAHDTSTKKIVKHTRIAKIKIGNNCFIGTRAIIMPGVTIGDNVVIGAGSVITKSFPSDVVIAGNPAKVLCSLEEYETKTHLDFKNSPVYGLDYTLNGGITRVKKQEQLAAIEKNGYVL